MGKLRGLFKSKLLQNSLWLVVLQVFNTVVPMLTLPYVTRVLAPSAYGEFSLALNWITYFQVIVEYGFGFLGSRKVATIGEESLQRLYSGIITARILLLAGTFLVFNLAAFVFRFSRPVYICMLLLFSMVVGMAFQLTWLFQGKQNMKLITVVNAISRLISVALIFLMVRSSNDVNLYAFLYSITFILSAVLGLLIARRVYGVRLSLSSVRYAGGLLREGWPLFISQAMAKIVSGFGITSLGFFASSTTVGIYAAIYKIPYIITLFFSPVEQALFPDSAVNFDASEAQGKKRVKKIANVLVPFFLCIAVVIILLRKQIIYIAFGESYLSLAGVIIPLSLWLVVGIINNFLGVQMLVASGHQKEYSIAFTGSAVLSVVFNLALSYQFGAYGSAWAALLSESVLTLLLMTFCRKVFSAKSA